MNTHKNMPLPTLVSIISSIPFIVNMFYHFIPTLKQSYGYEANLFVAAFTLFILIYSARHFFTGAFYSFLAHNANMDTLIAMGTGSAWLYSTVVFLFYTHLPAIATHLYFDSAIMIIAFVNLGQFLEERARGKTSEAIQSLLALQPKTARRLKDGDETDVNIEDIHLEDVLRIRPGEQIPVDGRLIEGKSSINESMLTGESEPVNKKINSTVRAGTLNISGSFLMRTVGVGKDTALSQIVELVKQAQHSKPAIGRLVDKIAGIFAPLVLISAIITALIWLNIGPAPQLTFMIVTAMTVLVIACPCALGLGVPMSIMVAVGRAATAGILVRNGDALQIASKLDTIVLDKTGTITIGKPSLTHITALGDLNASQCLELAYSLEAQSEHPVAHAINESARHKKITLLKTSLFQNIEGFGIRAKIDGNWVILGKRLFMEKNDVDFSAYDDTISSLQEKGDSIIFLALDNQPLALFSISDPIHEDAARAIQQFNALGLHVKMLTGDNQKTAELVAKKVGINDVHAELLPHEKLKEIQSLIDAGHITAMVGDGINDAPGLAKAHVGFAIGSGTDVAMKSADVVLMTHSLLGVSNAIQLSKKTLKNIKQNLFAAFFYNTASIPIAAGVFYPVTHTLLNPAIAGLAMAASSLTVVLNANRLRFSLSFLKKNEA